MKYNIFALIPYFLLVSIFLSSIPVSSTDWPQFLNNAPHTNQFTTSGDSNQYVLEWTYDINSEYTVFAQSPVISDGKLFFTGDFNDPTIYYLDAITGDLFWTYQTPELNDKAFSSPAILDNKLVIPFYNGKLYCLQIDGVEDETPTILWKYPEVGTLGQVYCSPTVYNSNIYFTTQTTLFCIDSNGNQQWTWEANPTELLQQYSSPAVDDTFVYFVSNKIETNPLTYNACIRSLYTSTGVESWNTSISIDQTDFQLIQSSPTLYENNLYIGSYCLAANTGAPQWFRSISDAGKSSPAAISGKIFIGEDSYIRCYDSDITDGIDDGIPDMQNDLYDLIWEYDTQETMTITSPIVSNKYLFTVSNEGTLYSLDSQTGTVLWTIDTKETSIYTSPIYTNNRLYIIGNTQVYCYRINTAPTTPQQTSELTKGPPQTPFSLKIRSTDLESDTIFYQVNWGDDTTSDWLGPYASGDTITTVHTWDTTGIYAVKTKAKDTYSQESSWSEPISFTITDEPTLMIQLASLTLPEHEIFIVTILDSLTGLAIEDATVLFNDNIQTTTSDGHAEFITPDVNENTELYILVTKAGYDSQTKMITVLDITQQTTIISGTIRNSQGMSIPNAQICIIPSNEIGYQNEYRCTFQKQQPTLEYTYQFQVNAGTYTLTASAPGYQDTTITPVLVSTAEYLIYDFTLSQELPKDETLVGDPTQNLIDYVITNKAAEGLIGAQLSFTPQGHSLNQYLDDFSFSVQSTNDIISFSIAADDTIPGTILVVHLGEQTLTDITQLQIRYDCQEITEYTHLDRFLELHTSSSSEPGYILISTKTNTYLFFYIPHFSTHTITISSLIESLNIMILGSIYFVVCLLILIGVVIHVKKTWKEKKYKIKN